MAELYEIGAAASAVNVTLVTTAETIIITSEAVNIPYGQARLFVNAWAQLTTGVGTTAVTPRIRRGTLVTDTLVGEANAEGIKIAAGGTEPFKLAVLDTVTGYGSVQYVFTLEQTAATGNGTALQAGIVAFLMS